MDLRLTSVKKSSKTTVHTLICACAFRIRHMYKSCETYTKSLTNIIKRFDREQERYDFTFRLYFDESITRTDFDDDKINDENERLWKPLFDMMRTRRYCELVRYYCPEVKDQAYHLGLFGTLVRLVPLFMGEKTWTVYMCIDIDVYPTFRSLRFFLEHDDTKFIFKTASCYYLARHCYIQDLNTWQRIIASHFMSKIQFPRHMLTEFMKDLAVHGPMHRRMLELQSTDNRKRLNDHFPYGCDEVLMNDIVLRYMRRRNIRYAYFVQYDNLKNVFHVLKNSNNFENPEQLDAKKRRFFVALVQYVLQDKYDPTKSLYDSYQNAAQYMWKCMKEKPDTTGLELARRLRDFYYKSKASPETADFLPDVLQTCIDHERPMRLNYFFVSKPQTARVKR